MNHDRGSVMNVVLAAVLAVAAPGPVGAAEPASADWPQFKRDAARTGDSPGAALAFPLQRTTAVQFPAPLYASPAVVGDRVYVQDARGHVACIDSRANQVLWVASIGGINNTSSPAVADGKVFVGSTAGHLAILDAATGKQLRQVPAEGGVLAAPAVANDAVYFSTLAGKLTKINFAGDVRWTYRGGSTSTVELAVRGRDIAFLAGTDGTLVHRLHDDGDQVSATSKPAPARAGCPVGGPVFVGPDSIAYQCFDSEFGRLAFDQVNATVDVNDSRVTPSVRDGLIYRGDKCVDPQKRRIVWRADPAVLYDGGFHSSPALGNNVLAVGSELGVVHFFALDGSGILRKPVWQFRTARAGQPNSAVSSSPALVDGRVFFGGEDGILYGLGQGKEAAIVQLSLPAGSEPAPLAAPRLTGADWPTPGGDMGFSGVSPDRTVKPPLAVQWRTRLWSTHKAPMVVANGMVFSGGRLGNLTALDAATGAILWKTHHPGVESRPGPTFVDGKLVILRSQGGQGDSPYTTGASKGGPPGEGVWCHDAATGQTLWHKSMPFRYHFNADGLAVHAGKVFVLQLDADQGISALALALDSGREVWRQPLKELAVEKKPAKTISEVRNPPSGIQLPPRFAVVVAEGLVCLSVSDRGTAALDPDTGKIAWTNPDAHITFRSRIAARNGVLVVFTGAGDQAFDVKSGKPLWNAKNPSFYGQALTDRYLESQGKEEVRPSTRCAWPVWANDTWYYHQDGSGKNTLKAVGLDRKTVWSHPFLSHACPSPAPAYGRLYYSACGEGVVYCFTNANGK